MASLRNKMLATVEFTHDGKTISLEPETPVECSKDFLMALSKYPAVTAYFDEGRVELTLSEDEQAAPKTKKSKE